MVITTIEFAQANISVFENQKNGQVGLCCIKSSKNTVASSCKIHNHWRELYCTNLEVL